MKKYLYLFVLIFSAAAVFGASQAEVPDARVITDSTGHSVTLSAVPERITFVGRASIMVADAVYMFPEAEERIVGVGFTNQGNGNFTELLDSNYESKIHLEHNAGPEQIAATKPDLVILKNYLKESTGDPLGKLGIPVLYLDLESPEAYEEDIKVLGEVFDSRERAEEILEFYQTRTDAVVSRISSADKPEVLFLYHSTRDGVAAFNIPPGSWIQTRMVEMAGGDPVWKNSHPGGGWSKISLEQAAAWNPDQIYVVAYKEDVEKVIESMYASPEWRELKAVKNGRLKAFPVDYYSWDQPDSRWVLGLEWLASEIHPELFSDFDVLRAAKDFFSIVYDISEEEFDREIRGRLGW